MIGVMWAAAVLGAACAALWGWGRVASRLCGVRPVSWPVSWPVTVAVGMAVLLVFGGVANLLGVAGAPALHAAWGAGLFLALHGVRSRAPVRLRADLWALLPAALVLAFLAATHLPPSAYNPHDDIEKYFAHPVRMLQTGTVFGSPLSALGTETLGGMAWLSAILVEHLPIGWYGAVDGVFGVFLCLALGAVGLPAHRRNLAGAWLAQAAILLVPPQITNAAPFYLGVAGLMALTMLAAESGEAPWTARRAMLPGLLCAALVALKPTFLLPAALHVAGTAVWLAARRGHRREGIVAAVATAGWAALFAAPWALLHAPHYLAPWIDEAPRAFRGAGLALLSFAPMQLGGSPGTFLLLAAAIAASALAIGWTADPGRRAALSGAVAASSGAFLVMVVLLAPLGNGPETHIRYAIPYLIAGWAAVLSLMPPVGGRAGLRAAGMAAALPAVALMAVLAPAFTARVRQVADAGSWLAYLGPDTYGKHIAYTRAALGDGERERIRRAQAVVPEGAGVVAWVGSAVHLDFRRNRVYEAEPAGIASPWARWPDAEYVLWQYDGTAVRGRLDYEEWMRQEGRNERRIGERAFAFVHDLERRARRGAILYDDGQVIVFRRR